MTVGFSAVNSVSAHACLPVSVCRSHLPFPASSRVPFIPFRKALSFDWGGEGDLSRDARQREARPHAKCIRIEARISNDCLCGREVLHGERRRRTRGEPRLARRTIRERAISEAEEEETSRPSEGSEGSILTAPVLRELKKKRRKKKGKKRKGLTRRLEGKEENDATSGRYGFFCYIVEEGERTDAIPRLSLPRLLLLLLLSLSLSR